MTKKMKPGSDTTLSRRRFFQLGLAGAAALGLPASARAVDPTTPPTLPPAPPTPATPEIWVFDGKDKKKLMEAALKVIGENGGFGKDVKDLALKVNAAWARTPEQGANTHPELVDAFLTGVKSMGITRVTLPENPCDSAGQSFPRSGIQAVAEKHGVSLIDLGNDTLAFKEVDLPGAKVLKKARVASQFLTAGAVVNMPVAKHHGSAKLSIAMKNWMGIVEDRGFWHKNNLHQCIADFCTFFHPAWTIIDATRCMIDGGPKGPTKNMMYPNLLIVSKDQVAADAYACSLFHDSPSKVGYLVIASEMNLGVIDVAKMKVTKIEVS